MTFVLTCLEHLYDKYAKKTTNSTVIKVIASRPKPIIGNGVKNRPIKARQFESKTQKSEKIVETLKKGNDKPAVRTESHKEPPGKLNIDIATSQSPPMPTSTDVVAVAPFPDDKKGTKSQQQPAVSVINSNLIEKDLENDKIKAPPVIPQPEKSITKQQTTINNSNANNNSVAEESKKNVNSKRQAKKKKNSSKRIDQLEGITPQVTLISRLQFSNFIRNGMFIFSHLTNHSN